MIGPSVSSSPRVVPRVTPPIHCARRLVCRKPRAIPPTPLASASLDLSAPGRRCDRIYPSLHLPRFLRSPADLKHYLSDPPGCSPVHRTHIFKAQHFQQRRRICTIPPASSEITYLTFAHRHPECAVWSICRLSSAYQSHNGRTLSHRRPYGPVAHTDTRKLFTPGVRVNPALATSAIPFATGICPGNPGVGNEHTSKAPEQSAKLMIIDGRPSADGS
jgi:hypothetical protein